MLCMEAIGSGGCVMRRVLRRGMQMRGAHSPGANEGVRPEWLKNGVHLLAQQSSTRIALLTTRHFVGLNLVPFENLFGPMHYSVYGHSLAPLWTQSGPPGNTKRTTGGPTFAQHPLNTLWTHMKTIRFLKSPQFYCFLFTPIDVCKSSCFFTNPWLLQQTRVIKSQNYPNHKAVSPPPLDKLHIGIHIKWHCPATQTLFFKCLATQLWISQQPMWQTKANSLSSFMDKQKWLSWNMKTSWDSSGHLAISKRMVNFGQLWTATDSYRRVEKPLDSSGVLGSSAATFFYDLWNWTASVWISISYFAMDSILVK